MEKATFTPDVVAGYWITAGVDSDRDDLVDLHVSISLASPEEQLIGKELAVELKAGNESMKRVAGPDPSEPLPVITTRGGTAFGQFTFSKRSDVRPTELLVHFRGESTVFRLSEAQSR